MKAITSQYFNATWSDGDIFLKISFLFPAIMLRFSSSFCSPPPKKKPALITANSCLSQYSVLLVRKVEEDSAVCWRKSMYSYLQTQSTVYSLQSTVYSLQSTVYCLQSTVYSLLSTVSSLQSPVDSLQSPVYSLLSTVYCLQSTVYSLQSPVYSLQSTV